VPVRSAEVRVFEEDDFRDLVGHRATTPFSW
jgi:hypothetical protein